MKSYFLELLPIFFEKKQSFWPKFLKHRSFEDAGWTGQLWSPESTWSASPWRASDSASCAVLSGCRSAPWRTCDPRWLSRGPAAESTVQEHWTASRGRAEEGSYGQSTLSRGPGAPPEARGVGKPADAAKPRSLYGSIAVRAVDASTTGDARRGQRAESHAGQSWSPSAGGRESNVGKDSQGFRSAADYELERTAW